MKCKKCGYECGEQANFCGNCGTKVREVCDCPIKKRPYNCGMDKCPGPKLFLIEVRREREKRSKS